MLDLLRFIGNFGKKPKQEAKVLTIDDISQQYIDAYNAELERHKEIVYNLNVKYIADVARFEQSELEKSK